MPHMAGMTPHLYMQEGMKHILHMALVVMMLQHLHMSLT